MSTGRAGVSRLRPGGCLSTVGVDVTRIVTLGECTPDDPS